MDRGSSERGLSLVRMTTSAVTRRRAVIGRLALSVAAAAGTMIRFPWDRPQ
jgi:hypothetical protein